MLKILVCNNDAYLKLRLNKIFSEANYQVSITDKPIKKDDLMFYNVILIHSSYRITDLFGFIENAVIQRLSTFIYITLNTNSNPFRRFSEHQNFIFVDESKIDVELPLSLRLIEKYSIQIDKLTKENTKLDYQLKEIKALDKCKRFLMKKGYSEDEAHKHILKYAMNNKIDKYEACNRLLKANSE